MANEGEIECKLDTWKLSSFAMLLYESWSIDYLRAWYKHKQIIVLAW